MELLDGGRRAPGLLGVVPGRGGGEDIDGTAAGDRVVHKVPPGPEPADHSNRIELRFLPSYSPELQPDELVNADLKRSLPMSSRARDQAQLVVESRRFFHRRQRQPRIFRGYCGGPPVRHILETEPLRF
ncbi:transposase [Streptomyces sp. NPDC003996]